MTPRSWFTLVLRGIGVWHLADAAVACMTALNVHLGFYHVEPTAAAFINQAIVHAVVGAILLFKASFLAALLVPAQHTAQIGTQTNDVPPV